MFQFYLKQQQEQAQLRSTQSEIRNYKNTLQ